MKGAARPITADPRVPDEVRFELTLFVAGASEHSARAIGEAQRLCETHLAGRYALSIVDIHDDPAAVRSGRVRATPTLVRTRPAPERSLVGDLSNAAKVLAALGLPGSHEGG
jgi:circadian clock protein KaiB